jgi:hypothetical protein
LARELFFQLTLTKKSTNDRNINNFWWGFLIKVWANRLFGRWLCV